MQSYSSGSGGGIIVEYNSAYVSTTPVDIYFNLYDGVNGTHLSLVHSIPPNSNLNPGGYFWVDMSQYSSGLYIITASVGQLDEEVVIGTHPFIKY